MKLINVIRAYGVVASLCEREMSYQDSYAVVTLKRRLKPHADYYGEKEMALVEKHAKKENGKVVWKEGGRFVLNEGEEEAFFRAKAQLDMVDIGEIEPVVIRDVGTIKGTEIEALEGLVVFGEE